MLTRRLVYWVQFKADMAKGRPASDGVEAWQPTTVASRYGALYC